MSDPTENPSEATLESEKPEPGAPGPAGHADSPSPESDLNEEMPDGGQPQSKAPRRRKPKPQPQPQPEVEPEPEPEPAEAPAPPAEAAQPADPDDDEPVPELVWYVLKVQSSREDTIRDALQRRVKIQGLEKFFGKNPDGRPRIVVPTEKITEIRNNKKRIVERKTYPGYIMVQMELNEKTWFLVRETPGVGDFVGAHGTPTKMTEAEVNQMLHQEEEKTTAETPKVRIDVERGDRVKIKDGPFENFEGTVEEVIEGRGLVQVMLIIFNRPTPVDLEYWQLERI
jgi:transcriptional antiterminator NusG